MNQEILKLAEKILFSMTRCNDLRRGCDGCPYWIDKKTIRCKKKWAEDMKTLYDAILAESAAGDKPKSAEAEQKPVILKMEKKGDEITGDISGSIKDILYLYELLTAQIAELFIEAGADPILVAIDLSTSAKKAALKNAIKGQHEAAFMV